MQRIANTLVSRTLVSRTLVSRSLLLAMLLVLLDCSGTASAQVVVPGFSPTVNNEVRTVLATPDGKLLIGGEFGLVNGQLRSKVARLHADGTLDTGFVPPQFDDRVRALALAPDGKILVGGEFKQVGGDQHLYVVRLNTDGSLDTSFNSGIDAFAAEVMALAVQDNGDVLVGGRLRVELDETYEYIVRLKAADGSLDTGFFPQLGDEVQVIVLQPPFGILVGGYIDPPSEESVPPRYGILRLTNSGDIDGTFQLLMGGDVRAIALQPDGRILVGGNFGYVDDVLRPYIARLSAHGALDPSLIDAGIRYGGAVRQVIPAADGRIIVVGDWSWLEPGQGARRVALLKANGERDLSFNEIHFDSYPGGAAMLPGGRIVLGGSFTQPRPRLLAIDTQDPTAMDELEVVGTTVSWWRSGLVPALLDTPVLEASEDGVTWTVVGTMTATPLGWELTGYNPPGGATGQFLRVNARVAGGGTIQTTLAPTFVVFADDFE